MKQEIAFLGRNTPVLATMRLEEGKLVTTLHPSFKAFCSRHTINDMVSHFRNVLTHGTLNDAHSSE